MGYADISDTFISRARASRRLYTSIQYKTTRHAGQTAGPKRGRGTGKGLVRGREYIFLDMDFYIFSRRIHQSLSPKIANGTELKLSDETLLCI